MQKVRRLHSIFYFGKILGFNFLAFQQNAQLSPQDDFRGLGTCRQQAPAGITEMKFLSGRHLLRKDALLASNVGRMPN
jgi:hypothetical protein